MTASSLDRDSRRDSTLLSDSRENESLSILLRDGVSSFVDEQRDSVLSVPLDEQGSDGGSTLRSSNLLVETEGED